MPDFLDLLAQDAKTTMEEGYYDTSAKFHASNNSMHNALSKSQNMPIIAEIKGMSPSRGIISKSYIPENVAIAMANGGAAGISVLTEPKHFGGSLSNLTRARQAVNLPILMKDVILSPLQLDVALQLGSNAVLLIQAVFDRGYGELGLTEMIDEAHSRSLEVLLESHDENEFERSLKSNADLLGINNRNLGSLTVDLNVTKRILENVNAKGKIVVSESGIKNADDIKFLRKSGATAFLIGCAIMSADDVESKMNEFTQIEKLER